MMGSKEEVSIHVFREIFTKKLKKRLAPEGVYAQLKQMILSGKLKKG
jgi:DNA-binding GntR family transcriptional regulator